MDPDQAPDRDRAETPRERYERLFRFMREEIWPITAPNGPPARRMPREQWARYLGYGPGDE